MEAGAIEACHLALVRVAHAAGAAFGYDEAAATGPASRFLTIPTTIAPATLASAVAATITYLM